MEFIVNDYITLKLENNKTVMYVNGEEYNLCCGVLVNVSGDYPRFSDGNQESVDFIVDSWLYKSTSNDEIRKEVTPEEEFWAYCSNLQVWAENNYNTDLLHYDASIPLLVKLKQAGDPLAKEVFKQEMLRRIKYGTYWAVGYFKSEGYLKEANLTEQELIDGALDSTEADALKKISKKTDFTYVIGGNFDDDEIRERPLYRNLLDPELFFTVKNGHITALEIELNRNHSRIPEEIKNFTRLKFLHIWVTSKNITILPPLFNNRPKNILTTKVVLHDSVKISRYFIHHLYSSNFEITRVFRTSNPVKPAKKKEKERK